MTTLAEVLWKIYSHQVGENRLPPNKARDLESVACEAMRNNHVERVRLDTSLVAARSNFSSIHFSEYMHAGDIVILDDLATSLAQIECEVA